MSDKPEVKKRHFIVFYQGVSGTTTLSGTAIVSTDGEFVNNRSFVATTCKDTGIDNCGVTNIVEVSEEDAKQWAK